MGKRLSKFRKKSKIHIQKVLLKIRSVCFAIHVKSLDKLGQLWPLQIAMVSSDPFAPITDQKRASYLEKRSGHLVFFRAKMHVRPQLARPQTSTPIAREPRRAKLLHPTQSPVPFLFLFVFARFPKFITSALYTTIHFCSGCRSSASRPIAPFDAFALIPTRAL